MGSGYDPEFPRSKMYTRFQITLNVLMTNRDVTDYGEPEKWDWGTHQLTHGAKIEVVKQYELERNIPPEAA